MALLLGSATSACTNSSYYELCPDGCDDGGSGGEGDSDVVAPRTRGGAGGSGGRTGEGGSASAGGAESVPRCETTKSPIDEPCLLSDAFAVFAHSGVSNGDGSEKRPLSSLTAAIELAAADGKIVVACAGTYNEALKLVGLAARTRLRVFGGFNCANPAEWRSGGGPTRIRPAQGAALHLEEVHDITFADLQFLAAPAQAAGENSVAGVIARSTGIELQRVTLVASNGKNGANGAAPPARAARAPDGNPARPDGGAIPRNDCPCGTAGAAGGERGASKCQPGSAGASAAAGKPGFGASSLGALDGTTWKPADGEPGEPGSAGRGGAGGGGDSDGGGGGGACGGCGGRAGEPGRGGGASIGLMVLDSKIELSDCTITTGNGGSGGAGQPGQPGQPAGDGGPSANACAGGDGGDGSNGGAGGGGAGGISVGILNRGDAVDLSTVTVHLGNPGEGGDGGGSDNHGLPGEEMAVLPIGA